MKRVAANKVMIDEHTLLLNTVVEYDDNGVVTAIFPLSEQLSEPASTCFFNGLITTEVSLERCVMGTFIPDLLTERLSVGYKGRLLLWQNINFVTLKVTSDTKIQPL
ncbi:MAG TPA: hypothetical protein P5564_00795 [Paludibacteraceae bacterium]|nr:hypothetical protein [Paludibacteraceae bacterium]